MNVPKRDTGMAKNGIKKVKLTGGEPLLRGELSDIIRGLLSIPRIEQVTLTTNGVLLKNQMNLLFLQDFRYFLEIQQRLLRFL